MREKDLTNVEGCLYAISHIEEYVKGIFSSDDLFADIKTYDAVLMNFIILGESASKIGVELKGKLPDIDWKAINGFRNFIAHEYFGLDKRVIWSATQNELPKLKEALNRLLRES